MSTAAEAPALIQYACERCKTRFVLPPSSRRLGFGGRLKATGMAISRTARFHEGLGTSYDGARRQLLDPPGPVLRHDLGARAELDRRAQRVADREAQQAAAAATLSAFDVSRVSSHVPSFLEGLALLHSRGRGRRPGRGWGRPRGAARGLPGRSR